MWFFLTSNRLTHTHSIILYEFPFSFARNFLIDQKIMMKAKKANGEGMEKGGKRNTSNCCFFYEARFPFSSHNFSFP